MTDEGSGSIEPDPTSVSERERLRRQLYTAGGLSADQLERYARLVDSSLEGGTRPPAADEPPVTDRGQAPGPVPSRAVEPTRPRRRRARLALLVGSAAGVCTVLAVLLGLLGPHPLPTTVPVPSSSGVTVLYHSRVSNPASASGTTTFVPPDYAIFDPQGRRVVVLLRCVGRGRVLIYAGARYTFTCTQHETLQQKRSPAVRRTPFTVYGRTVGNVVWSVRVVLQ